MATSLHAHYVRIDQILGTQAELCLHVREEVDPQQLMLMSLLLRSVRARGKPERGRELALEAMIRDTEDRCKERMISTFATVY